MKLLSRLIVCKKYWRQSLGLALILLAGCTQGGTFSSSSDNSLTDANLELPTRGPTTAPTPANTRVLPLDSLTPAPTPTITPIPAEVLGLVVQVIDGDTIAVVMEGDPPALAYEVSYIGVEAPSNTPANPWGVVAYETNRKMTGLKVVRLVRDETELDEEGRLLRHVYVDNQLMSIILAEQGLVEAVDPGQNREFQAEIAEAEARAEAANLGLWAGANPTATATRAEATTEAEVDETETTPEAETTAPAETGTPATEPGESTPELTAEPDETLTPTEASPAETTPVATPTRTPTPEPVATEDELN
ncbi:MAG: thermonuclease family protein [Anaerolineae bacterium]|nr:thermonuclease family protein [Anaerolineae bacterium]